jgi:hypothetical protein
VSRSRGTRCGSQTKARSIWDLEIMPNAPTSIRSSSRDHRRGAAARLPDCPRFEPRDFPSFAAGLRKR